jgi:hypothetical protein
MHLIPFSLVNSTAVMPVWLFALTCVSDGVIAGLVVRSLWREWRTRVFLAQIAKNDARLRQALRGVWD